MERATRNIAKLTALGLVFFALQPNAIAENVRVIEKGSVCERPDGTRVEATDTSYLLDREMMEAAIRAMEREKNLDKALRDCEHEHRELIEPKSQWPALVGVLSALVASFAIGGLLL